MNPKAKNIGIRIALLLLLTAPNLYALSAASDLSSPAKAIAYLTVVVIGLMVPMLFLRARTYFIVMGILYLFCAPIEIASLFLNHNPATATFVDLFYATNWREIIGVVGAIWPLLIIVVAVWISYFFLASRQANEWMIPRRTGLWIAGIGLPVLFAGAILFFSRYARNIYNIRDTKEVVRFAKDLTLLKFYKIYPYNIYLNTIQIARERADIITSRKELEPFRFGITARQDSTPELYILVIGEAARSDNFGLNGYERATTPRLQKRSNLVSFPNAYSQAGITEQSVPHMLSRISITLHEKVLKEKTLPEAFQEAGYEASWLTNKSRALYLQRVLDAMDRRFETGKDMNTTNNYDELLLSPLQEVLRDNATKRFIVVHTMGSHWRYDTRYTSEFEQFTPSLGKEFRLTMISPDNKQRLVNAYDNTICYTDYFLDSLISLTEQLKIPAVVMYMSDHGENLYDDERNLVLHGNYSASRWLFHVPLIIWYSDAYASLYPDKVQQLHAHARCKDNSSVLFPSMLDAAGLRYTNDAASNAAIRTRSIFSPDYCPPDTLFVMTAEGECIVLTEEP